MISKEICIQEGLYRFEAGNLTIMYDKSIDSLMVGFKNAAHLDRQDLEKLHGLTGELLKEIENEERKID